MSIGVNVERPGGVSQGEKKRKHFLERGNSADTDLEVGVESGFSGAPGSSIKLGQRVLRTEKGEGY